MWVLRTRTHTHSVLPPSLSLPPSSSPFLLFVCFYYFYFCRYSGAPATVTTVFASSDLPRPEQWLGNIVTSTTATRADTQPDLPPSPAPSPRRAPYLSQHLRAHSLGSAETFLMHRSGRAVPAQNINGTQQQQSMWAGTHNANGQLPASHDPFDAEWAAIAARNRQAGNTVTGNSTNPFISAAAVKTFEVHM